MSEDTTTSALTKKEQQEARAAQARIERVAKLEAELAAAREAASKSSVHKVETLNEIIVKLIDREDKAVEAVKAAEDKAEALTARIEEQIALRDELLESISETLSPSDAERLDVDFGRDENEAE